MHSTCGLALLLTACVPIANGLVYNETRAIEYANLAGAAYCDAEVITKWTCGSKCFAGVENVHVCQGTFTQAFVGVSRGKCIASFEGTHDMWSMENDLKSWKSSWGCDGCRVHHGFLGEWSSLSKCIIDRLTDIGCGPGNKLYATGHSLGAAVVSLAMFDMGAAHGAQHAWDVVEIYNFGMPRAGNAAFAKAFNQMFEGRFFRVTHGQDPFVDVPPNQISFFDPYVSVEPEVFYKGNISDGYVICNEPDDTKCSAQFYPESQYVTFASSVAWHHEYLGIDMTQAGCKAAHEVGCGDAIPDSWCVSDWVVPCNKDVRGAAAYCTGGKCACGAGSCPLDGKCVAQNASTVSTKAPDTKAKCHQAAVVGKCVGLGCFMAHGSAHCEGTQCLCDAGYCSQDLWTCINDTAPLLAVVSLATKAESGKQQDRELKLNVASAVTSLLVPFTAVVGAAMVIQRLIRNRREVEGSMNDKLLDTSEQDQ